MSEPEQSPTPSSPSPTNDPNAASDVQADVKSELSSKAGGASQNAKKDSPRDRFEQHVANRRESLDDHEPEKTLWSGGYSPKAMVGWWSAMTALSIVILVGYFMMSIEIPLLVPLGIILILWLLLVANYLRMRLGFHYELTSQRFIHKTGLLTRRSDRIEVIDIDDVSYEQGPVQRLLGVGSINISSSDRSDPHLHLLGIDKVSEVAGLIDDVRRSERRRRSLHIESI
jgi:membrane protein YdbS with pleckstrin-like domain